MDYAGNLNEKSLRAVAYYRPTPNIPPSERRSRLLNRQIKLPTPIQPIVIDTGAAAALGSAATAVAAAAAAASGACECAPNLSQKSQAKQHCNQLSEQGNFVYGGDMSLV